MNPSKKILTILSCGGMEITWRYAWAFFLTLSILNHPLPLLEPTVIFFTSYLVTTWVGSKNWRVYQSLSLHWAGFAVLWLLTIHRVFYGNIPLSKVAWMADWIHRLQDLQPFVIQLVFMACLLSFWLGARAMAKRKQDHQVVCLHFDKGLGALFLLLLVKLIAEQKGGLYLEDPATRYLLFAYFTSGLIAIGLSRPQSKVRKTFRPGYHGVGIILGFVTISLIAGAVLTSFFLPLITDMADSAQSVLKETAAPLYPVLVKIIRFVFSAGRYRRDGGAQISGGSENQILPDAEMGWMHGFGWVTTGVVVLAVAGLCAYVFHRFVRWFLSRNGANKTASPRVSWIAGLLSIMAAVCLNAWKGLLSLVKKPDSAAAVYMEMLRWERRSGVPASPAETPIEYGGKLGCNIPDFRGEIDLIVETYCKEIYGNRAIDKRHLSRILSARRKMQSPRYWLYRLKGWFVQQPL